MAISKIEGCPKSDLCSKAGFCLGNGMDFYRHMKRIFCPDGIGDEFGMQNAGDLDGVRDRNNPNSPECQISTE